LAVETNLLELRGVEAGYGDVPILRGVDLRLALGTITAVIGANGAGKSTLLKTVFGLVRISGGQMLYESRDVTRAASAERIKLGIAIVPQGRCNFPLMSVQENLEMAAYTRRDAEVRHDIEEVYSTFEVLGRKRSLMAGNMSGGEQQMLEMSMALLLKPRLILLDEPSLGLAPVMQKQVFEAIVRLRDLGRTILMVEQNAVQALGVADRAIVIELGRVSHEGSGVAMLDNADVRRAYLGLPA
jgi:ABC-type branched-subunit amino acid transport system ATPase component